MEPPEPPSGSATAFHSGYLHTGSSILANIEDPDAAFHQGLHSALSAKIKTIFRARNIYKT